MTSRPDPVSAAAAERAARLAWLRRWWSSNDTALVEALVLVMTLRVVLTLIGILALGMLPEQHGLHSVFHRSHYAWLDIWARWDSEYYLDIAQHGYRMRPQLLLFYPLYPMLVAAVRLVLQHGYYVLSGVIVSTVAFVVALAYLYKLAAFEFDEAVASRAVLYQAIYPTALFALAVYTESLFLAVSVATFYYARRGRWVAAAIAVFLAALARGNGIVLLFPLAYEVWRQSEGHPRRVTPAQLLGLIAAPLGAVLWAAYLAWLRHDPLALLHIRSIPPFQRQSRLPWQPLVTAVHMLQQPHLSPLSRAVNTGDLAAALVIIGASIVAWWRLPRAYAIYLVVSLLLLLSSSVQGWPLQSMQRYSFSLFPIFLLLALLGANRHWHRVILLASAPLLGMYMALFAQWYWVF